MSSVYFVDSSVLFNLLDVPGKNSDRSSVAAKFKRLAGEAATFVFPVTAVIETGNVIAQLPDGNARRACMERFVELLRKALAASAPLAVSGVAWDEDFLTTLLDGGENRMTLVDFATTGLGSGDASLLLERERYRAKVPSATPIQLWTLDQTLSSYG